MSGTFLAIDLKSFFASVECVERGLDPLAAKLVVADESRTSKTICLAVTPALKDFGIGGRDRLWKVEEKVKELNRFRKDKITYIVAPPRMALYIEYSARVYNIYLKYFAPEDIHVYSIDEVFIDATHYLSTYKLSARDLTRKVIADVLQETGITATAGIGTNLYLCKVAMDIMAKHVEPDADGVRIAELDEMSYRRKLWDHSPLTDFWRIGHGTAARLNRLGIQTMGDLARYSLKYQDFLFKEFGAHAEFLIDHAWGYEPCTMVAIKKYQPHTRSLSHGQVFSRPYKASEARIAALEMTESLTLDLVRKGLVCSQLNLYICYDTENVIEGEAEKDYYGRLTPKHTQGVYNFQEPTSSGVKLSRALKTVFDKTGKKELTIRRIYISVNKVIPESETTGHQLSLFEDATENEPGMFKEKDLQESLLSIREKFGNNSILRAYSFEEGATAKERNTQIGGHKA